MKYVLALGTVLLVPALAMGAAMSLTSGGLSSLPVAPGATIPVLLSVDTQGIQIAGFEVTLSGSAPLTVSNFAFAGAFSFNSGTANGNLAAPKGPATGLALSNQGPGIVPLATMDLTVNGGYVYGPNLVLSAINVLVSDALAQPVQTTTSPLTLTPEPVSLLLLGLGGLMLRRRR